LLDGDTHVRSLRIGDDDFEVNRKF